MDASTLTQQLPYCITETHLSEWGTRYEGKVRDTYRDGDTLTLVTTDRISSFDHVLPQAIPFKGQVLNQLAAFFFEETAEVVPNHVQAVPDPNITVGMACTPIPIEFVVRGYLAGHAARTYQRGARVLCGQPLPDGLREGEQLPNPIVTPATKAETGHDEDITPDEAVSRGLVDADTYATLEQAALDLFARGTEIAAARDLILVDTKYEFGRDANGQLRLIDEVHTPDSSRYYEADGYEERLQRGEPQKQLSKEFVREWLMEQGFRGREGETMPDLPDAFRIEIAQRYIDLYERLAGQPFEADVTPNPEARMRANLQTALS
jgi:phosphoribosylaminoimidazole-succinocarboxamide synthase